MEGMLGNLFDSPMVSQIAFHPTTFAKGSKIGPNQLDGTIPVGDGVELAYRLFNGTTSSTASRAIWLCIDGYLERCG